MKLLVLTLIFLLCPKAYGQEQEADDVVLWQLVTLTPENGNKNALMSSLTEFIDKYNNNGTCRSWALEVKTGEHAGELILERGPLSPVDLTNQCFEAGNDFWNANVQPHIKHTQVEYFQQLTELDYSDGISTYEIQYLRVFRIRDGMDNHFEALLNQISNQIKTAGLKGNWSFFKNHFEQHNSESRHYVIVSYFSNMAELTVNYTSMDDILDAEIRERLKNLTVNRSGFVLE